MERFLNFLNLRFNIIERVALHSFAELAAFTTKTIVNKANNFVCFVRFVFIVFLRCLLWSEKAICTKFFVIATKT